MERIAKFEIVSFAQYKKDYIECLGTDEGVKEAYNNIKIPTRATSGSAGYDFCCPFDLRLNPGKGIKIPTGIRVRIADGWALFILPKSGLGIKYRFQLDNTLGLIDSDYYNSANEGHIMIVMRNNHVTEGFKGIDLKAGKAFAQAVFLPFGITENDIASGIRQGGFGSTNA